MLVQVALLLKSMQDNYGCLVWSIVDEEQTAVRFITSWATPESIVDDFIEKLKVMGLS